MDFKINCNISGTKQLRVIVTDLCPKTTILPWYNAKSYLRTGMFQTRAQMNWNGEEILPYIACNLFKIWRSTFGSEARTRAALHQSIGADLLKSSSIEGLFESNVKDMPGDLARAPNSDENPAFFNLLPAPWQVGSEDRARVTPWDTSSLRFVHHVYNCVAWQFLCKTAVLYNKGSCKLSRGNSR